MFRQLFRSVRHLRRTKRSSSVLSRTTSFDEETPVRLPDLPPEIWLHILRFATYTNPPIDEASSSEPVSFLSVTHSRSSFHLRLAHYHKGQRRKVDLASISRAWNAIMQEIIWESVWIYCGRDATKLAHHLQRDTDPMKGLGRFIRRLQIETPSLEKCSPHDIRVILDHCPRLVIFSDYRSVRRVPADGCDDSKCTPEKIFEALAGPGNCIQRLSWTNYDDFSMHERLSPMLEGLATHLSFLELNFCFPECYSRPLINDEILTLELPALRTLKCTLDNSTLAVLARWSMPLVNLSILSADFSYWSSGFTDFFLSHGEQIKMLELVHSSTMVEEHSINLRDKKPIPLAAWCPNLKTFICSADAEWDWSNPNWIAPHVLLPSHPTVEFIGIRDIHRRLLGDMEALGHDHPAVFFRLLTQVRSLLQKEAFPCLRYLRDMSWESDILRRGGGRFAEPPKPPPKPTRGRYEFGRKTRAVMSSYSVPSPFSLLSSSLSLSSSSSSSSSSRASLSLSSASTTSTPASPLSSASASEQKEHKLTEQTKRLLAFWKTVMEQCGNSGVWLEDVRGYNVRFRDLQRVEMGLMEPCGEELEMEVMGW